MNQARWAAVLISGAVGGLVSCSVPEGTLDPGDNGQADATTETGGGAGSGGAEGDASVEAEASAGGTGGTGGAAGVGGTGGSETGGTGGTAPDCTGEPTQPCGNCGTQTRTCDNGVWSGWGTCTAEGECAANATQACGTGGTQTCSQQCQWGQCTGQTCSGVDTQVCGNCGTQTRTCDNGVWSAWGTCTGQGQCAANTTQACGTGGTQTCSPQCQWGQCTGQTCGSLPCGALEECFNGEMCVAKKVTVTGGYAIDATEVTRSQYQAWLNTSPTTSGQPSYCSWNTSYTPNGEWPPGTKASHPVVYVQWCDAYAYCKAVGKRLCGKIGGGANAFGDYANATSSQWYHACTSNEANDYPYGDTYNGQTCNGMNNTATGCGSGTCTTTEVGSLTGCVSGVSGYTGVYDLSENVWEWEDSCSANSGSSDVCRLRGGSFNGGDLRCGNVYSYDRSEHARAS